MAQNNNHNNNDRKNSNQKRNFNQRNSRSNYRKNRNDYHKKSSRYNSGSMIARINNPRREETVDDIKMDIEKLEKDIQFEIKHIRSIKLGL